MPREVLQRRELYPPLHRSLGRDGLPCKLCLPGRQPRLEAGYIEGFTSLRYSDAWALKKSAVGKDYIDVVTQKTSDRLRINLNEHSRTILKRYKKADSEFALPRITNNRLNKLLKIMGKKAGFDEPISISQYYGTRRVDSTYPKHELLSTHCGRRTFISNALALGIAPVVVMQWTGHSEFTSLKPYLAIADKQKEYDMRKFDKTDPKKSTKKSTKNPK